MEMAIVITIIGFIVSGIMYGRSLIATAKLQAVITDVERYTTAAQNFRQVYMQLPGDFINAQSLWGIDPNCTGTYFTLTGFGNGGGGSGTCNGDGNGQILNGNSAETYLFWQHLYLAKMYSGPSQDCTATNGGNPPSCTALSGYSAYSVIGFNVPVGSIKGSGFTPGWVGAPSGIQLFDYYQVTTDSTPTITTNYGNVLFFGASGQLVSGSTDYNTTWDPILQADQAAAIDSKMDDGNPASGKVRAFIPGAGTAPNCTIASNSSTPALLASTSTYNVKNSTLACSLLFVMGL